MNEAWNNKDIGILASENFGFPRVKRVQAFDRIGCWHLLERFDFNIALLGSGFVCFGFLSILGAEFRVSIVRFDSGTVSRTAI